MTTIGGTAAPARSAFLRRHAGLLGALALSVACVLARDAANAPRLRKVDRHHLFGFDAYVYVAMAEDPTFFTVAPWGIGCSRRSWCTRSPVGTWSAASGC